MSVRLLYPESALLSLRPSDLAASPRGISGTPSLTSTPCSKKSILSTDDPLARRAGELADVHRLRGYDAVHLAAADRIRDPDVVVIAGDSALRDAATAEGMSIAELP